MGADSQNTNALAMLASQISTSPLVDDDLASTPPALSQQHASALRQVAERALDKATAGPLSALLDHFVTAASPVAFSSAERTVLEARFVQFLQLTTAQFSEALDRLEGATAEEEVAAAGADEGEGESYMTQEEVEREVKRSARAGEEEGLEELEREVERVEARVDEEERKIMEDMIVLEGLRESCSAIDQTVSAFGSILRSAGYDDDALA